MKKLKAVAQSFRAVILKAYYAVSDLFRVVNDELGLQLDFMSRLDGIRSFEGLRSRSTSGELGNHALKIASLADIIKSKRATGRDRDLAVLEILERTLNDQEKNDNEKGPESRTQKGE